MGKKRIIKKLEMLPDELIALVKLEYPEGYEDNLITFQTATGELATGIPLETEDAYYLIKLPKNVIPEEDADDAETSSNSSRQDSSDSPEFENLDNLQIADEVADDD